MEERTMPVTDRNTFEQLYAGQPRWEIGRPQKAFLDIADRITGAVLDSGCGTGENALFFASLGQKVTGIDFLAEPVEWAKQKAAERSVTATFFVMDALALKELPEVFDNVIDSGLFHVFSDEDRKRYVEGLASVLKPGGRFFLLCFSTPSRASMGRGGCLAKRSKTPSPRGGSWKASSHHGTKSDPIRMTPVSRTVARWRGWLKRRG